MGFFQQRAEQAAAQAQERATKRATKRAGKPAEPTEPEHCRAPGRTLARPAWWPEEEPNWTDPEFALPSIAPRHRASHGKRKAVRLCPVCHEQRSTEGTCWCGSDEQPARVGWQPAAQRTPRVRTIADREPAWWAAHRRLHPVPGSNCERCQVAHGLAD